MYLFRKTKKSIPGDGSTSDEEAVLVPVPVPEPVPAARMKEDERNDRKRRKGKKKRSDKQRAWNAEFQAQRRLYTAFHAVLMAVCPAWELFAEWMRRVAHSGDNCFHAINHKYMDGDKVGCPELFHFSQGELAMPWDMKASREGDTVLFTWHDERDCPHARGSDRLVVGILHDEHRGRPVLVETQALRSHGAASITLDPKYGKKVHVYPFFERADKRAYSDDQHFEV